MNHDSKKDMAFYFLKRIDYNQEWKDVEYGMGYDFGDFNFDKPGIQEKIRRIAKQIHLEFEGFFNEEGD